MAAPPRSAVLLVAGLLAPFALTACSFGDDDSGDAGAGGIQATEDAGKLARERVQAYLDAMRAKDVAAGREQLCAALRDSFDVAATGSTGDFAKHFKVTSTRITDVTPDGGRQRVGGAVTVKIGTRSVNRAVDFSVVPVDGAWCIADEAPAASAGASADPSPSS